MKGGGFQPALRDIRGFNCLILNGIIDCYFLLELGEKRGKPSQAKDAMVVAKEALN